MTKAQLSAPSRASAREAATSVGRSGLPGRLQRRWPAERRLRRRSPGVEKSRVGGEIESMDRPNGVEDSRSPSTSRNLRPRERRRGSRPGRPPHGLGVARRDHRGDRRRRQRPRRRPQSEATFIDSMTLGVLLGAVKRLRPSGGKVTSSAPTRTSAASSRSRCSTGSFDSCESRRRRDVGAGGVSSSPRSRRLPDRTPRRVPGDRGVPRASDASCSGGIASRFELPVDRVDDLLLAVESLLAAGVGRRDSPPGGRGDPDGFVVRHRGRSPAGLAEPAVAPGARATRRRVDERADGDGPSAVELVVSAASRADAETPRRVRRWRARTSTSSG